MPDGRSPLRVGIVLDGPVGPAWLASTIVGLGEATCVDVRIVVLGAGPSRHRRGPLLLELYERIDRRLFRSATDSLARVDLPKVPLERAPVLTGLEADSTLSAVRSAQLDVLLWFASSRPRAELLECARFGVWALNHDESLAYPAGTPFVRQLLGDEPVGATTLQILGADRDRVIYRSISAIDPHSLYRSRNRAYWKAAHFMRRRLEHLHTAGWEFIEALPSYNEAASVEARSTPSGAEVVRFLARLAGRAVRSKARRLFFSETWFLGYRSGGGSWSAEDLRDCSIVFPQRRRYFADPFVVSRGDRHWIFFEDYRVRENRGVISCLELDEEARPSAPQVVLERNYHLSYPFLFALEERLFMIPESAANEAVELYRAEEFPCRWVLERTLMSGVTGVDATLVQSAGKLWLFMNVKEHGAAYSDELCVFHAESLAGPWTSHWLNPVVSDVRSARPAGRIFERDGVLFRPAQDSSTGYGLAVVLNRIDVLSEAEYRETPVARIDHSWCKGNIGTHTYNFDGRYEVVDGRRWEPRFRFRAATRPRPET